MDKESSTPTDSSVYKSNSVKRRNNKLRVLLPLQIKLNNLDVTYKLYRVISSGTMFNFLYGATEWGGRIGVDDCELATIEHAPRNTYDLCRPSARCSRVDQGFETGMGVLVGSHLV